MPVPTDVVPLGTASAVPAHGRHLSAFALAREGRLLLFDCGEGTQYRLRAAGLKTARLEAVFVTHLHGDHVFGLPGLLTTLALLGREDPLVLVGPEGLRALLSALPGLDALPFPLHHVPLREGTEHAVVFESDLATVEARPLVHRVPTWGYRYTERPRPGRVDAARAERLGLRPEQLGALRRGEPVLTPAGRRVRPDEVVGPERPGVVVAYCLDTAPCEGARRLAEGADLLVHDATFAEAEAARAAETGHATARQAAEIARAARVGLLLLSHFSARYPTPEPLVAEARTVFANTEAADELKRYRLVPAD